MRAILMTATGDPEVLRLKDVQQPVIANSHDIRVRIRAAGVNPVDAKLRSRGSYDPDSLPAIPGCDGAGIVEETGSNVSRFRPGDEIYYCYGGIGLAPGSYAESIVLDERHAVAHKPVRASFLEAAAAPLVLITAWESLFDRARMHAGQKVLIHAGAGGVGHVAIQLAKHIGCDVATTVSDDAKADFVTTLGADHVIRYRDEDVTRSVLDWTDGEGVDIAFDTVGGETFEQCFAAVRPYGDVVSILQPNADTDWKLARMKNLRISLELMLSPQHLDWPDALAHHSEILEKCNALFDSNELSINVAKTLPLEQAAEAHRRIEAGGMIGKLALTVV
ncbi:MAG: zinc-dependent alcohol dehydrogenase family protein [Mariprofundaceae bacterium]